SRACGSSAGLRSIISTGTGGKVSQPRTAQESVAIKRGLVRMIREDSGRLGSPEEGEHEMLNQYEESGVIEFLNGLYWESVESGIAACFTTDDIAAFGRTVSLGLGVDAVIADVSEETYLIVFNKCHFSRLKKLGFVPPLPVM